MGSEILNQLARGLSEQNLCTVIRFNFPYKEEGRKSVNTKKVLHSSYRAVRDWVRSEYGPGTLLAGGRSMGGRVIGEVEIKDYSADALFFIGYPLHPPNSPEKQKPQPLLNYTRPMLFIHGTRDALGYLDNLKKTFDPVANAALHIIRGANHSFIPRKKDNRTENEIMGEILEAMAGYVREHAR